MPQTPVHRLREVKAAVTLGLAVITASLVAVAPSAGAVPHAKSSAAEAASPRHSKNPGGAGFGLEAASKGRPDGRPQYNYSATPGGTLSDQIAVMNLGNAPVTLAMYPADASTATNGSFALSGADTRPTQVGSWLKLDSSGQITVPRRTAKGPSYRVVSFTLTVPRNATPGDHAGGIVVSLTAKGNGGRVNENLVQRVGYRVYVRVSGPLRPNLSIQNLSATYHGAIFGNPLGTGSVVVKYRVSNNGNVQFGARQQIAVSPWWGSGKTIKSVTPTLTTAQGTFIDIPTLLPGSYIDVTRVLKGVTPGLRVHAEVTLTPVVPAGAADPQTQPFSNSTSTWAIPWSLFIAIVIVLLVIAAWWWRKRRLRARGPNRHSASSNKGKVKAEVN